MDLTDPKMTAALIAAAVSIVTVLLGFLFKAWFERYFLIFRLEAEHRYEQKKKIKGVLARYKTQLLDSGEALNDRLWNFSENHSEGWHTISEQDEERLRWDRIQAFHYVLLMFLNTYGYDFQYTHQPKIKKLLLRSPRPNKVIQNLKTMLNRMHLDTQKEAKKVLNAL